MWIASQEGMPNSCATAWTVLNNAMAATATVARRKKRGRALTLASPSTNIPVTSRSPYVTNR